MKEIQKGSDLGKYYCPKCKKYVVFEKYIFNYNQEGGDYTAFCKECDTHLFDH